MTHCGAARDDMGMTSARGIARMSPQLGAVHAAEALLDARVGQQRKQHQAKPRKADWERNFIRRQIQPALHGQAKACINLAPPGQASL